MTNAHTRVLSWLTFCAQAASAMAVLAGCFVLAGWMFDIAALQSVLPAGVTMKANTATAFVLAGASLWLLRTDRAAPWRRRLGQLGACTVVLVGLLTLGEYVFGWHLGIDQLLFHDTARAVGGSQPGRMAPITALNLCLLGCALVLLDVSTRRGRHPAQVLAIIPGAIGLLAAVGYMYSVTALYAIGPFTPMALHTAVTVIVLAAGILVARPDRGMMAVLTRDSVGGVMARRLVPAAIGIPLVLGWLRWEGQRAGLYGTAFGLTLIVIAHILVFTAFVWWTAGSLDRADVARRQAEEAAAARAQLAAIVEASVDAITGATLDGTITSWNPGAARLYGYRAEEAIGRSVSLLIPPDQRAELPELLSRVARGESIPHYETERLCKDGTRVAVSLSLAPVRAASGAVVAAAVVAHDITARKRAEDALRASEERFRSVTESAHDAIIAADSQGAILSWNAGACTIFGYRADEVVGQPLTVLMPERYHAAHRHGLEWLAARGTPRLIGQTVELHGRRKDGSTFPLDLSLSTWTTDAGRFYGGIIRDITERKRAEEALREQAQLLDLAHDAIIVRDPHSAITFWNRGAERLYGWSAAEAVGQMTHSLLQAQFPASPADVDACLQQDGFWSGELVHTTRDGRQIVVESRQALRCDAGGRPAAILEINADITERKRGEQARAQLAAIVESSADAIIGKTLDGTITSWNPAAARLYGCSAAEAIGQPISLLVPPDRRAELAERLARVAQGESIPHAETEWLRKDGTRLAVSASIVPVRAASGAVVAAATVAHDVTERKRAEETLRESEARLGALLDAAPDASVIVDNAGLIARVNTQAEWLFGYAREELVGRPVELLLPERFRHGHVRHREAYAAAPRPRPMGTGQELYVRRKDGSEVPVEISLSPLHTAEGALVITDIRDITERKRMEEQRQRAEVAERAVRDRDEFLSVAAHELKTPLTSLSGFAQVLLRGLHNAGSVDPARLGRALRTIETQADKVDRLVDQLLDVTRLDAGRLVLEPGQTDLCALLREVVDTAQGRTTQHTLVVQAPPVLCAWVDALRLEQVLTNLLSNAIKYSPQGGTITCTLSADSGGDAVQLAVRDQGIGIPPAQRARIFDRYHQAHASSHRSGLGLGLYISRQIVVLHGGHLTVQFPPEGGSLFIIRLPTGGERRAILAEGGRHDDTQAYPGH